MRNLEVDEVAPETWGEGLVSVPLGETVRVAGRLESVHEGILVTGEARTVATGECGRCLDDVRIDIEVAFQELFAYHDDEASEHAVHEDHVILEPIVRDAVVLALPFQPMCQPDCPGLDPQTGEKRLGPDTETQPGERDPRWAALASYMASDAVPPTAETNRNNED